MRGQVCSTDYSSRQKSVQCDYFEISETDVENYFRVHAESW